MNSRNKKQTGRVDSMLLLSAVALLAAAGGLAYNMWQMSLASEWDEQYRSVASELRIDTQEIKASSRAAFSGQSEAFESLAELREGFPVTLNLLRNGNATLPAPGEAMNSSVNQIGDNWEQVSTDVDTLLAASQRLLFIQDISQNLNQNIKTIQAHYADLVDILGDSSVSKSTLLAAQQQLWLIERIGRNIDRILVGDEGASAAAEEFKRDAMLFQRNMEGMREGDASRDLDRLTQSEAIETQELAAALFTQISSSVNEIYDAHEELIMAAQAAASVAENASNLSDSVGGALVAVDKLAATRPFSATTATYLAGICLLLLAIIAVRFNGSRSQERQSQAQAAATEEEVQLKVTEIQPLAEGNLSRDLTVTDGITQPIAVAINQLLDWIRSVVTSVKDSSREVKKAVDESTHASADVKSSLEKVGGIVADTATASSELSQINSHMAELAETTDRASDEAVSAAREGDVGIENLMVSVEEIRGSQQTVAKTSKRLGDDIDIVADLLFKIREVANAISTLAMNTRIEAASHSGEGGQRFAGIADETGKLANQTNDIVQEADRAIRSVSNRMAETNRNMEGATQSLVKLTGIAAEVRERFGAILSLSENTRNYMGDMRNQIEQSGVSAGKVTESVSDILEKTLETQRAADRMDSSTNDLRDLFDSLSEATQRFVLSNEDSDWGETPVVSTDDDDNQVYAFNGTADEGTVKSEEDLADIEYTEELTQKAS